MDTPMQQVQLVQPVQFVAPPSGGLTTGKTIAIILGTSVTTVVLLVGGLVGFYTYQMHQLQTQMNSFNSQPYSQTFPTISNTLP
jgi:hypothetical protein